MGLISAVKSGARSVGSAARKGQVAAVRGGQAALGVSYGAASDVAGMGIGAGAGLLRAAFGSNPIKHAIIPKLGVAVPVGLTKSAIARSSLLSAGAAGLYGAATIDRGAQPTYQYPDEPDGMAPQFKDDLGANGNMVLQSYYAGRKY